MATNYISSSNNLYKKYVALLAQTFTGDPQSTVLENTLGEIVWTRNDVGSYIGTLTGAFTNLKTVIFMQVNSTLGATYGIKYVASRGTNDTIYLLTQLEDSTSTSADDLLTNTPIEIRVYN